MAREIASNAQELTNNTESFEELPSAGLRRSGKPRSATVLKLQWLAERLRKVERIKKQVAAGTYSVDSTEVAIAMLGIEKDE